jgi:uncharacterized protein YndB with AHSA1/START domain
MTHGTFETVQGRPTLSFERRLAHPVEKVWAAVTEPEELAHWFPATVTVDLRVGGAMTFDFGYGGEPSPGEVTELDPPRVFAFVWGAGDQLRFELEPAGDGTLLRFSHEIGDQREAARGAAGWHVCLDTLEQRLAGEHAGRPNTGPTPEWEAHYEEYAGRGFPAGAPIPGRG